MRAPPVPAIRDSMCPTRLQELRHADEVIRSAGENAGTAYDPLRLESVGANLGASNYGFYIITWIHGTAKSTTLKRVVQGRWLGRTQRSVSVFWQNLYGSVSGQIFVKHPRFRRIATTCHCRIP